jgi:ABC-type transport system involved in cytochrome c biogenesis permease subunit
VFSFAAAVVLTGTAIMETNPASNYPPALQSPFFIPHVLVYMISYSLGAVAFVLVIMTFFKKEKRKDLERTAYCCIRTLFPFMTSGMFLGAIWADQVWGEFWSWDIKENWSLVTWLLFMLYLHCYRRKPLKKYTRILAILGFVGIVITFLFVNVINNTSSVHVYS